MKKIILTVFLLFIALTAYSQEVNRLRSLEAIFPGLGESDIKIIFSERGLRNYYQKNETPLFVPASNSGVDILSIIMEKKPTQIISVLTVMPYSGKPLNMLDAYNAMGKIEDIRKHTFPQRSGPLVLFEESTRIENNQRNRAIPDPLPATMLPSSETVYFRLKDTFFGNAYFRGDFLSGSNGITCNITNSRAVWYLIFPVLGAEKLGTVLYVEPLAEGMLVYGMAGIDIPDFIAQAVNLESNINRRLTVFINWLSDSFKSI